MSIDLHVFYKVVGRAILKFTLFALKLEKGITFLPLRKSPISIFERHFLKVWLNCQGILDGILPPFQAHFVQEWIFIADNLAYLIESQFLIR